MRLSVIITTCDRPVAAAVALHSVLAQDRQADEIVVVDDGLVSPFELPEDIPHVSCVQILRTAGRTGPCAARNAGASIVTGDVLMFLDDDDSWESGKASRQMQILSTEPDAVLVYTGRLVVSADDRRNVLYKIPAEKSGHLFEQMLSTNIVGTTSGAAIRTSAFHKVGAFDEQQPALNDYDLWIRLSRLGKVIGDRAFNARYTVGSEKGATGNVSRGPTAVHRESIRRIQQKYAKDFDNLSTSRKRKAFAQHAFLAAKNARVHSWSAAVPAVSRAFIMYPSPKFLLLLLPRGLLQLGKRIVHRRWKLES